MSFKTNSSITQFGGQLLKLTHESKVTKTPMNVNVFIPPAQTKKTPVLVYLSGLTCTPDNATEKSFFAYFAAKYGFALVFPDTSPRGANIKGEDDSWDFGTGAGFYVDATQSPWSENYRMYSYVHGELQDELAKAYPELDFDNVSITGHSMGGMGALVGFLRQARPYKSVSAFSPISNPSVVQWGEKNFGNYLGEEDKTKWAQYDPTELIKSYKGDDSTSILIHQGLNDNFYENQLKPENLVEAGKGYKGGIDLRLVDGYDHSYFFISTFVEEHAKHHAKYLGL
ncbi:hypothetical protein PVL30_002445 [Lodderomyces elongisporus]|uniref:S-formylglutathione hydrolase n=1 Tax=Lodderomyces elongisporus (strain ATCC 11503 / CBS 2605 / JCM 1781 / NBRC 1676 / NRRL YB-4239) TaxID=379508 RepID=A5E6W1_LODEL|nr:uncharacterized protein PVL30_002445 [Lodderomyces elongisporus]EDK47169.1 esterase D [Lodderomyces elongisporus NRRL YB-4239]WLF78703.1 hypothetical protein PVL30_002445 [Lodderomyces elongisporus]